MSLKQVLDTVGALLQDPALGLAARTDALAGTAADGATIRSDFNFTKWALRGTLNPATSPNVMLRPRTWTPDQKLNNKPQRDAGVSIDIGYEYFGSDPVDIQENVAVVAAALAQVIDGLRDYSDAHQGTVIDVDDPLRFACGEFAGPASAGFLATIAVLERSSQ